MIISGAVVNRLQALIQAETVAINQIADQIRDCGIIASTKDRPMVFFNHKILTDVI
jgi:hypothetical protein